MSKNDAWYIKGLQRYVLLLAFFCFLAFVACDTTSEVSEKEFSQDNGETKQLTKDAIREEDYCFGIWDQWKVIGLEGVHGGKIIQINEEVLSRNDFDILSLFPAYFDENYTDAETRLCACSIATSLTDYIIETYGESEFYQEDGRKYINEWLDYIGYSITYSDPFLFLQDYSYSCDNYYSIIIETDQSETIFCQPLDEYIQTAFDLRSFLHDIREGKSEILEHLKSDSEVLYEMLIERRSQGIKVYFDGNNGSYTRRNVIHLGYPYAYFYCLLSVWLQNDITNNRWAIEGLCMYLPYKYFRPLNEIHRYQTVLKQTQEIIEKHSREEMMDGSFDAFYVDACLDYLSKYDYSNEKDGFDILLFQNSMAAVQFAYMEAGMSNIPVVLPIYQQYNLKQTSNGNELTAEQACSLVNYMISHYGWDSFYNYVFDNRSFKATYGMLYIRMKEAWVASIS